MSARVSGHHFAAINNSVITPIPAKNGLSQQVIRRGRIRQPDGLGWLLLQHDPIGNAHRLIGRREVEPGLACVETDLSTARSHIAETKANAGTVFEDQIPVVES